MKTGLFGTLALALSLPSLAPATAVAQAPSPTFDCAKAEGAVEGLICRDEALAALDREVARLYRLARGDEGLTGERRQTLVAAERSWIQGRDDCGTAEDVRACVLASCVIRIHELRSGHPAARSEDAAGISKGPFAVRCEGFEPRIDLVFVSIDPPVAFLLWRDEFRILEQTRSGSGARYAARNEAGETVFWIKGNDARFELPGREGLACHIEPPA